GLSHSSAPPTPISPLSLHDALPICADSGTSCIFSSCSERSTATAAAAMPVMWLSMSRDSCALYRCRYTCRRTLMSCNVGIGPHRSEEHTSELQSRFDLVCRLLLEKK